MICDGSITDALSLIHHVKAWEMHVHNYTEFDA